MIIPAIVVICEANQPVKLNREHSEYQWCTLDEAIKKVPYPTQKKLYRHIWEHFIQTKPSHFMHVELK